MLFGKLLPAPPPLPTLSLPLQPHPAREHSGTTPQRAPSGGGDSVPNLRSNLEASFEKEWEPLLEPRGAAGSSGLPMGLFLSPWPQAAPPPDPPGLGHSQALDRWGGRTRHPSRPPPWAGTQGAASSPTLPPLPVSPPPLLGLHLALRIGTCDLVVLTCGSLPT